MGGGGGGHPYLFHKGDWKLYFFSPQDRRKIFILYLFQPPLWIKYLFPPCFVAIYLIHPFFSQKYLFRKNSEFFALPPFLFKQLSSAQLGMPAISTVSVQSPHFFLLLLHYTPDSIIIFINLAEMESDSLEPQCSHRFCCQGCRPVSSSCFNRTPQVLNFEAWLGSQGATWWASSTCCTGVLCEGMPSNRKVRVRRWGHDAQVNGQTTNALSAAQIS